MNLLFAVTLMLLAPGPVDAAADEQARADAARGADAAGNRPAGTNRSWVLSPSRWTRGLRTK